MFHLFGKKIEISRLKEYKQEKKEKELILKEFNSLLDSLNKTELSPGELDLAYKIRNILYKFL